MLHPRMNACLAQLSEEEFQSLESHLKLVALSRGQRLYDPGDRIQKFLFPVTAKLAIAAQVHEDLFSDVLLIGAEGMVGRRLLIDGISTHRVYVTVAGFAYEVSPAPVLHEFRRFAGVHDVCLASIEHVLSQISHEVICSRFHTLEQRLAKWLLLRLDEDSGEIVEATHQCIATSLGYKREAITLALRRFQGLEISRGKILVTDRGWLSRACCPCYVAPVAPAHAQLTMWT